MSPEGLAVDATNRVFAIIGGVACFLVAIGIIIDVPPVGCR